LAKRRSNESREIEVLPSVTPEQGVKLLRTVIDKGRALLNARPVESGKYDAWSTIARDFLTKTFGSLSPNVSSVMDVGRYGSFALNAGEEYWEQNRAENLEKKLTILEGLVEVLQTEIALDTPEGIVAKEYVPTGSQAFLVHGRDASALEGTARFLEKLGVPTIVLHEQPDQGRTIIEKFVDFSNVAFAVVLLTGDDRGGVANAPYEQQKLRARQNVIFELGYFIGKLGRNRVCALYRDGVEIPSDYEGVLFVPFDEGGAWKLKLAKEMKAAGLQIDMNRAL
jgi:predicted nucleotide-binding protein